MGFRLVIIEGKGAGKDFYFSKPEVKIGRSPENDLVLYDMGVSRIHTEIIQDSDGYTMRDTGSANGTLLNGIMTTEAHIRVGDKIQVGPVVFQFEPAKSPSEPSGVRSMEHGEVFRPESDLRRRKLEKEKTTAYRPSLQPQPTHKGESTAAEDDVRRTDTGSYAPYPKQRFAALRKLPRSTRVSLGFGLAVVLAGVTVSAYVALNKPRRDRSSEIFAADRTNAALTFGFGKVDVHTPDRVNFKFDYSGGRVTVLYAAGGVESEQEVEVLVNKEHASFVAPSPGRWTTGLKLDLPRRHLKPGVNIITFDNRMTPQRQERWGVAQVRVKETPLPAPDEAKAAELFALGVAAFDARSVLPANLARSIEYYEEAQLYLEAMASPPKLFTEVRTQEARARAELQKIFDSYLFASEKSLRFGDREGAVQALRDLLRYFPDPEDPRHKKAKSRLTKLVGKIIR